MLKRLERERAKLELVNVELSDKVQKTELELMGRTKEREDLAASLAHERKVAEDLRRDAVSNSNALLELRQEATKYRKEALQREAGLRETAEGLEREVEALQRSRQKLATAAAKVKELLRVPFRIERKLQGMHLFGLKLGRLHTFLLTLPARMAKMTAKSKTVIGLRRELQLLSAESKDLKTGKKLAETECEALRKQAGQLQKEKLLLERALKKKAHKMDELEKTHFLKTEGLKDNYQKKISYLESANQEEVRKLKVERDR